MPEPEQTAETAPEPKEPAEQPHARARAYYCRQSHNQLFVGKLREPNPLRQGKDLQTRRRQDFWAAFVNVLPAFRLVAKGI